MRWPDENKELFKEHCLLAAVAMGHRVSKKDLQPLIDNGLVKKDMFSFHSKIFLPRYFRTCKGNEKYLEIEQLLQRFYREEKHECR